MKPKFEWFDEIDINWRFEDGVMIEEHTERCHCGDCTSLPGTNPGAVGTNPTKE